ncbi:MAG: alpha/beta fold hydrolase [Bacteroidia bacterium]
MPVISSTYKAPRLFRNGHLNTIVAALFRKVKGVVYERERMQTGDSDFIDLDWHRHGNRKLVLLCHGLESSANEMYMRGLAQAFRKRGWDAVAMNFRGCSGEPNRQFRSYHSGATDDLHEVLEHIRKRQEYRHLALVGVSLGGNVVLKYVGEQGEEIASDIVAAAGLSVPCDLKAAALNMARPINRIYMNRFLKRLKRKILEKNAAHPGNLNTSQVHLITDFRGTDDLYTAPAHGFADAEDYWAACSSKFFVEEIAIPALLITAADDPFFTPACFPFVAAEKKPNFYLEIPEHGGHVGFVTRNFPEEWWHETRIAEFIEKCFSERNAFINKTVKNIK